MKFFKIASAVIIMTLVATMSSFAQQKRVLIFSKTMGFRHSSIEAGKPFFQGWGKQAGVGVDLTENADDFNEENLKKYNAVVFLSTTGDVLNPVQQADFERYIQAGGGYMGVHAASDTEYNWPWYNDLMGGYFASHPGAPDGNVQNGKMIVMDKNHPSTAHLPDTFEREDEFYDFKSLKKDKLNFLVRVDEDSYKQGKMGDFHPMAWYHEFDGGKAFYTNYGHTNETFTQPDMQKHLIGGLTWAMADKLNYANVTSKRTPEENRFVKTNLVKNLFEPTELAVMPNGKVIFTERRGALKVWNPTTNETTIAATIDVYDKFEYGLMGIGLDPKFEENNWVYLYYTPSTEEHKDQFLSRFKYDQSKNELVMDSEKVVLRFPAKRVECCHTGGSIDWDGNGNLFLSTGDDTNPFASDGYAPIDFQEGRAGWDALRSSGNTNDLRGKILRITPQNDGTYTIPEGNLFAEGTAKTRPEIYVMGCRNPYRIAVDKRSNYLYWGDVGPDAGKADPNRGPDGQVEFNQARRAGNYGWPMFVGNNDAYNAYDFATKTSGSKFDPDKPINNSPNNTGLTELPPTNRPLVWYGYGESKKFPLLEKGGANPMGGPVYYSGDHSGERKFPEYFDGKFFTYEWMRDWIILVDMDKEGNYTGMERFMPNTKFYHPMDMTFGKDGKLYLLEYGMNWFAQNEEAMLSVIEFNPGNRTPVVKVSSSIDAGASPLKVSFSSDGSMDYDDDKISYLWEFGDIDKKLKPLKTANPTVTFNKPGNYEVALTVTDSKGNSNRETTLLKVGNDIPEVSISVNGNKSFFFEEQPINYEVKVADTEDGSLVKGIKTEDVVVNINYLEGYDKTMIEQGHKSNVSFVAGKRLIEVNDCKACHNMEKKSIGPAYKDVATKYKKNSKNIDYLASKIIKGGGGVWGEQGMSAHPDLSKNDAKDMADYILSLNDIKKSEPVMAAYTPLLHKEKKDGAYLIQATYTDKGGRVIGPMTGTKTLALRSPILKSTTYDTAKDAMKFDAPGVGEITVASDGGNIGFKDIDLTGIKTIMIGAFSNPAQTVGGKVEVRSGSVDGKLLGTATIPEMNMTPQKVELKGVMNKQEDLYFVFTNPNASGKPLFGLTNIEFKR
jgi:cytochrome c